MSLLSRATSFLGRYAVFAFEGKQTEKSVRFTPRLEQLERRLPFAADLAIEFDLGETTPGLDPPEFVVVGGVANIENATAASLEDGGHLFVYSEEFNNSVEIYGRLTNPDGSPGAQAQLLKTVAVGSTANASEISFATTSLVDGGFALVWSSDSGVYAQLFSEQLIATSQEVQVAQGLSGSGNTGAFSLDVLQRLNGNIAIAYSDPSTERMTVREYPADLTGTPSEWQDSNLPNQNDSPPFHAKLQELPGSGVRLSWVTNDTTNSLNWSIFTVDVDSTANAVDRWDLSEFAAMPQVAYQSDGDIVLTGVQQASGSYQTVARLLTPNKTLLSETILSTSFTVLGDLHGIAVLDDDSYAVSGFFGVSATDGLFLQAFNASGDLIGQPELLSESNTNTQLHSGIFGLDTGGYAAYWLGYALDGTSPAVFSRTVQLESTEVLIDITDLNAEVNQAADFVIIEGVPESAGLNKGTQRSATSWEVPVSELDDLALLNFEHRESMSLEVSLIESSSNSVIASQAPEFGSEFDDYIPITSIDDLIDGRDGIDTVFISDNSTNFEFEPKEDNEFALTSNDATYNLLLKDVEFIAFIDETVALGDPEIGDLEELESQQQSEFDEDSVPWIYDDYFLEALDDYEFEEAKFDFFEDDGPFSSSDWFHEPFELGNHAPGPLPPGRLGEDSTEFDEWDEPDDGLFTAKPRFSPEARAESSEAEGEVGEESRDTPPAIPKESSSLQPEAHLGLAFPLETTASNGAAAGGLQVQLGVDLQTPQVIVQQAAPVQKIQEKFKPPVVAAPPAYTTQEIVQASATESDSLSTIATLETESLPTFENDLFTVAPAFDADMLFDNLDEVIEEAKSDQVVAEVVVGSAVVVATGVSIANVAWLLRGSVLFTKLLSSMPIWISFDPLPLLREVQHLPVNGIPNESLVDIASSGNE